MQCSYCNQDTNNICIVSMFIEGRNEDGIQNTAEIGQLCNMCVVNLAKGDITLLIPENALTFADIFKGM